ncbi:MAG: hypothetical protein M3Q76_08130 [Acidobacteriota bacterium]|nr:hypothetical protein [Acidobacteriota bacterium]
MRAFYLPIVLTIGGNLLYHLAQKSIPQTANPMITLLLAYAAGMAVCAVGAVFYPAAGKPFMASVREANWAVVAVGLGAATIEIGFLLAYRAGWRLSTAAVTSSVAVTVLFIPLGVLLFKERLSLWNAVGVLFCLAGLLLVSQK